MASRRSVAKAGTAAVTLALLAAACGGGGGGSATTTGPGGGGAGTTETIYQPSDKAGGTLRFLNDSDCDYWDPARTYYANCLDMQRFISRTLVTYDAKPGAARIVPDLAESVPTSPDSKTWTYKLKPGLKFQDGTPITSRDVKYAVERVFAQDVINGGPVYLKELLDDPRNRYPGPYKDKSPDKLGLKSVETPDDSTITFKLNKPFADWNYVLTLPGDAPVPRAKDTGARYTFNPVSSGPYKIEKYTPNKSISFVRNDQWSRDTDPVRKALPDRVEVTMGLELNDVDQRIISDEADIYQGQTGVQAAAQARILADQNLRKRSTDYLTGFLRYITVFTKVAPFDNIHCRKAVAWIVNKEAQQRARGGPAGGEIGTTTLTPPIKGYQKFDLYPTTGSQGDVAMAKAELAQCGKPNGFNTTITSRTNAKEVRQAEALQADLRKVGISATIDRFDPSQYFAAVIGIPKNVQAKKYGLAMAAWGPDWPSGWAFFSSIVDGRKILPQGNSNYAELNDPAINAALDEAASTTDEAKQNAAYEKIDRTVVDSAADIPVVYDKSLSINSSRLTNVYYSPGYLMTDFVSLGVNR